MRKHNNQNEWQVRVIRRIKRKKYTEYNPTPLKQTETHNRHNLLTTVTKEDFTVGNPNPTKKIINPPPIFGHYVINYGEMTKRIRDVAEDEQYCTKRLANNVIKINCVSPDTYRKLVT
jgi:hypothetical protein